MHQVLNRNIFQLGYVTADLDAAMEQYRSLYGIDKFMVINTADLNPEPALRVAMAWHGPIMIELIQPIDEPNPVYVDVVRASNSLTTLHHFGHVCTDEAEWDEMLAALDAENVPVVVRGDVPGLIKFVYGDFRPTNGHYREYVLLQGDKSFFDQIPRN